MTGIGAEIQTYLALILIQYFTILCLVQKKAERPDHILTEPHTKVPIMTCSRQKSILLSTMLQLGIQNRDRCTLNDAQLEANARLSLSGSAGTTAPP